MREEMRRREPTAVRVRQAKLKEGLSKMLLWYRNADWLTRRKHMLRERRIAVFPKIVWLRTFLIVSWSSWEPKDDLVMNQQGTQSPIQLFTHIEKSRSKLLFLRTSFM